MSIRLVLGTKTLLFLVTGAAAGVITGGVYDHETREPLERATIRAEGTGYSMVCNEDGQYRLRLPPGTYDLKFSHVAHQSEVVTIQVADSAVDLDVYLHPAIYELPGLKVYERAYDPAQRIIREAIAHKQEILSRLKSYRFDAYTRLVFHDAVTEDTNDILWIFESQLEAYWQQPNKYKQVITARQQTANIDAEENLLGVLGNFDFNADRITQRSIVSPTATDALDHYDYYLLDTTYIDGRRVFQLEFQPKDPMEPLFVGTMLIVDSLYAVVGWEAGFSKGVDMPMVSDLRLTQRYGLFPDELWMPIEVEWSGTADVPIPFFPTLHFEYVAALHSYNFDIDLPKGIFDEYVVEVAEGADEVDSAAWEAGQAVPLTAEELRAYHVIDSLENVPPTIIDRVLNSALQALGSIALYTEVFHFNRVEGAYLGWGLVSDLLIPGMAASASGGYALGAERWEHTVGLDYTLSRRKSLSMGVEHHDRIQARPAMSIDAAANNSLWALLRGSDSHDYYREKGYHVRFDTKVLNYTHLRLGYQDYTQTSVPVSTDYHVFKRHDAPRDNPAIVDGKLRSLSAQFEYDSRKRVQIRGRQRKAQSARYWQIRAGVEYANPEFISNDFEFTRYTASVYRIQRLPGLGLVRAYAGGGTSDQLLSPQRYFTINSSTDGATGLIQFKTLDEQNYHGDRAVMVYVAHDFGRDLFRRSGLSLVKDIPFSLYGYYGGFWTDFENKEAVTTEPEVVTAPTGYREAGFGLGRITPFTPFDSRLYFTWQLTDYPQAADFSIGLSIGMIF